MPGHLRTRQSARDQEDRDQAAGNERGGGAPHCSRCMENDVGREGGCASHTCEWNSPVGLLGDRHVGQRKEGKVLDGVFLWRRVQSLMWTGRHGNRRVVVEAHTSERNNPARLLGAWYIGQRKEGTVPNSDLLQMRARPPVWPGQHGNRGRGPTRHTPARKTVP